MSGILPILVISHDCIHDNELQNLKLLKKSIPKNVLDCSHTKETTLSLC